MHNDDDREQAMTMAMAEEEKKKHRSRSSIQCNNIKANVSSSLLTYFQKKVLVRQTHTTLPYHITSLFLNTYLV